MDRIQLWLDNVTSLALDRDNPFVGTPNNQYERAVEAELLLHRVFTTFHWSIQMARTAKSKTTTSWGVTFVSWRPSQEDKIAIREYVNTLKSVSEPLEDIIANGYKVSISYDSEQDTFITSLTNRDANPDFVNHCVTFRHRDMFTALGLLIWFELEFTQGDWSVVGEVSNFDW